MTYICSASTGSRPWHSLVSLPRSHVPGFSVALKSSSKINKMKYRYQFKVLILVFVFLNVLELSTAQRRTLYENDVCKETSPPWTCKKISECPSAIEGLKKGVQPRTCSFVQSTPVVCCAPASPTTRTPTKPPTRAPPKPISARPPPLKAGKSKALQKCQEYAKHVFQEEDVPVLTQFAQGTQLADTCAITAQPLVLGGQDAEPKEFPHMALIGYGPGPVVDWKCGGSLISERFVLSAAHCTEPSRRWGKASWAMLGELNIHSETDDAQPITLKITARYDHPDYDAEALYNDIALYKLEKDVQFNAYIRPICLPFQDLKTDVMIASGWGNTQFGGRPSSHLQYVKLREVTNKKCNDSFRNQIGREIPRGILPESMICAGDEVGKDTCQGDSGGPLQVVLKEPYCMYAQIGVTSFGKGCGQSFPGVYTRVQNYVTWIENLVWP